MSAIYMKNYSRLGHCILVGKRQIAGVHPAIQLSHCPCPPKRGLFVVGNRNDVRPFFIVSKFST